MWERFKSGAVIVFVTLMIWFAADQNVKEEQNFRVSVRLVSSDPNRYASIADVPHQAVFTVTLNARRRRIQEFAEIAAEGRLFEAKIGTSEPGSSKPQPFSARELLSRVSEFNEFGMGLISNIEPSDVMVIIDGYTTVENVRVEPVYGDLKVLATASPSKVSVRLPNFLATRLEQNRVASADAEKHIRSAGKPDGTFQVTVPLTLPALRTIPPGVDLKFVPSSDVTITGAIESLNTTRRKGPIQIMWSMPDQVQRDFRLVVNSDTNLRADIDVTGPKEKIEQLDPRDIRAFVDVLVSDTEKPGVKIRRTVTFVLPPGFTQAAGPPHEVEFTLQPLAVEPVAAP